MAHGQFRWVSTTDLSGAVQLEPQGRIVWHGAGGVAPFLAAGGRFPWQADVALSSGLLEAHGRFAWAGQVEIDQPPVELDPQGRLVWQGESNIAAMPLAAEGSFRWRGTLVSAGPGTGFVVETYIDYWREISVRDWFPVIFDYAGVKSITALARVLAIRFSDADPNPQVTLYLVPQITERTPADVAEIMPTGPQEPGDDLWRATRDNSQAIFKMAQE